MKTNLSPLQIEILEEMCEPGRGSLEYDERNYAVRRRALAGLIQRGFVRLTGETAEEVFYDFTPAGFDALPKASDEIKLGFEYGDELQIFESAVEAVASAQILADGLDQAVTVSFVVNGALVRGDSLFNVNPSPEAE